MTLLKALILLSSKQAFNYQLVRLGILPKALKRRAAL